MNKSKLLILFISLSLIFGACSSGVSQEEYDRVVAERDSALAANAETTENEDNEQTSSQEDTDRTDETENDNISEEVTSVVLLDADNIYVEFRGIEEYSSSSWIVNLYVENNRESEIYLSLRNGLINKYSISFSNNGISIPANSKYLAGPNFDLIINLDDLAYYGINTIETLDFVLHISTEMFGELISETPIILSLNKELGPNASVIPSASGEVLYNSDNIYVEFRGIEEYSSQSWIVNLYVENNQDHGIYISLQDELINGFSINCSNNGVMIPANSKYLAAPNFDLIINTEDLSAYGISILETINFNLRISTEMFGDLIAETPVNIETNKSIS